MPPQYKLVCASVVLLFLLIVICYLIVLLLFCFRCFACVINCSTVCVNCKFAAFAEVLCSSHRYPSFILDNHCILVFGYFSFPHFRECCFCLLFFSLWISPFLWFKLKERLALMIKCVFFFCWEEPDVHMPRSI